MIDDELKDKKPKLIKLKAPEVLVMKAVPAIPEAKLDLSKKAVPATL